MEAIERFIEVSVPVTAAYNQWAQFNFPAFMEGIKEVRKLDEKHLRLRADFSGVEAEWEVEVFEQVPDRRIAWRSLNGTRKSGQVNFTPVSDYKTRIGLKIDYDPDYIAETSTLFDALSARMAGDLNRFKLLLEKYRGNLALAAQATLAPVS